MPVPARVEMSFSRGSLRSTERSPAVSGSTISSSVVQPSSGLRSVTAVLRQIQEAQRLPAQRSDAGDLGAHAVQIGQVQLRQRGEIGDRQPVDSEFFQTRTLAERGEVRDLGAVQLQTFQRRAGQRSETGDCGASEMQFDQRCAVQRGEVADVVALLAIEESERHPGQRAEIGSPPCAYIQTQPLAASSRAAGRGRSRACDARLRFSKGIPRRGERSVSLSCR